MVWPFSSKPSPQETSSPPPPPQATLSPPQNPPSTPKPLTTSDLADQELASFLSEINADLEKPPQSSSKRYQRTSQSPSQSSPTPNPNNPNSNLNPALPISEHLLPTDMSCRTAFDAAFYCNSFGGRFNDLYRYGTLRSCSETWDDFWFCMKTKSYAGTMRDEVIRDHYRGKERRKYRGEGRQSSEDVWRSRERMVQPGEAFREPVIWDDEVGAGGGDKGWNERERERRRRDGGVD